MPNYEELSPEIEKKWDYTKRASMPFRMPVLCAEIPHTIAPA